MLLIEFTINGTLTRLSMEGIALTHWWDNKVVSFDSPQRKLKYKYGGYCELGFGSISFAPDTFESGDWPPPINGVITIKHTATTEAAAETIFTGMAHLAYIGREEIEYDLYGPSFTAEIADATVYNDTLVNVMTSLCGAGILNLTLNSAAARNPSPAVLHTTSGVQLAINLADQMTAFFSHMFYINKATSTLYLIDMLADNGAETITEFDFFPVKYEYEVPVAIIKDDDDTTSQSSSYVYGDEKSIKQFHTTGANIDTALADILTILHKPRALLPMPLLGSIPVPGKKISWPDTALAHDVDAYIRARNFRFDFNKEEVRIEGEGALS